MTIRNLKHHCFHGLMSLVLCLSHGYAQDTMHISIQEAEKTFLQNNLALLAGKYNIGIARAALIQAKLFSNPNLAVAGNVYNPDLKKAFDVSNKTGEYTIALQQLVRLAGKRNKEIRLAETATQMTEDRFFDLLRTLRYSLRSTFYNILYLQHSIAAYTKQVSSLQQMSNGYDELQSKGVVSLKDAVRIRSLLYSLKAEQAAMQNQVNDLEADMQLLLQNNRAFYIPVPGDTDAIALSLQAYTLQSLIDTANNNRYDLKLAKNNLLYSQVNYKLQKAMATPDLTLGAQFDKRGSFVENAAFFTVAMDLPFFNRNKGNIQSARLSMDQSKLLLSQQQAVVENDVQKAYVKVINTDKMLHGIDPGFRSQYEKLLQGVLENFNSRNISLIEFVDFYESYKNNIIQFDQLQNEKMQAVEALHFAIGKTLFNN